MKPRPPTLTSIPSLLSVLQNEWDALALETFALRQHLTQTRQELSNALYENDAAKRVIARLQRERDEARDALAKGAVNGSSREANGDAMQIDGQELSPALVAKVEATQEKYDLGHQPKLRLLLISPADSPKHAGSDQHQTTGLLPRIFKRLRLGKPHNHCMRGRAISQSMQVGTWPSSVAPTAH